MTTTPATLRDAEPGDRIQYTADGVTVTADILDLDRGQSTTVFLAADATDVTALPSGTPIERTPAAAPLWRVIRRDAGRSEPATYWNGAAGRWDRYDAATRYDHEPRMVVQALGEKGAAIVTDIAYPTDAEGFPFRVDAVLGLVRMTHCCGAATSADDTTFYCKSCYFPTDFRYEMPATLTPATV